MSRKKKVNQRDELMKLSKKRMKNALAPNMKWGDDLSINLRDAKKVISDYQKQTQNPLGVVELMVCYVEYGTDFLCEFGDLYEGYYNSLESVFWRALRLMKKFEYEEISSFEQRLQIVVRKSEHIGWGYYDAIFEMLEASYPSSP